jgi:hypothetical protein
MPAQSGPYGQDLSVESAYSELSLILKGRQVVSFDQAESLMDVLLRSDVFIFKKWFISELLNVRHQLPSHTVVGIIGVVLGKYPESLREDQKAELEARLLNEVKRIDAEPALRSFIFRHPHFLIPVNGYLSTLYKILKSHVDPIRFEYTYRRITSENRKKPP